jgi:uncharacterized membrane protein YjgN (DUF898 family)
MHPTGCRGGDAVRRYKLVCSLDFRDVLVQTLLWLLLVVVTVGLATPFFAYYFIRLILNRTEIHEVPESA